MSGKPVVMVVDDEVANIEVIGAILEAEYDILFARSGQQAIDLAEKNALDLILLDVVMPGIDGYETCRRIKLNPKLAEVPVIFTTSLDAVEHEVKGLAAGAIDYIAKPFQPVSLRRRVGNHVEMKQMRDRLVNLTMVDPLTGLGNRRMLDNQLSEMLPRLAEQQEWLSMVLIDIDFFKQFNDIYGHPEGDACLQRVSTALNTTMRRGGDFCTRYGGEEFACVLPATDLEGAMHLSEELRRAVEEMKIPHTGSSIAEHVTISVGVTSLRCDPRPVLRDCFARADQMLYQSKKGGRNRVMGGLMDAVSGPE